LGSARWHDLQPDLRDDATWHDGEPVTRDVLSRLMLRSENLPVPEDIRTLWNSVEVDALDEQTMQFRLPEPYALSWTS
jgi:ABC-type transport system substrate-binding protein